MTTNRPGCRPLWQTALTQRFVWKNASIFGLSAGILQAGINQGDYWIHHAVNASIILKTLACPLASFSVAFISAAATWAAYQKEKPKL